MSATVPTFEEFDTVSRSVNDLKPRTEMLETDVTTIDDQIVSIESDITDLKAAVGNSVKERPWEQVVVAGGFNDLAVQNAMSSVMAAKSGVVMRKTLVFPPGDFHLTKPLITSPMTNTELLEGLKVSGQGKRMTKIFWDSNGTDATDPMQNTFIQSVRRHRFLTLENFSVYSSNPVNSFAYLYSDTGGGYNHAWNILNIEFSGAWNRVFGLDGGATANLNSEFTMDTISSTTNSTFKDAFFRSGGISGTYNQQNQFLNYWVKNSNLTLSSGIVFRLDRGGNLHLVNGSTSAVSSTSGPITWFYMPLANHNNRATTQLSVRNVKFEPKAANQKIIDCAWASGTVTFEDCSDNGAMQNDASMAMQLHRYVGASPWTAVGGAVGPTVRYRSCALGGGHVYEGEAMQRGNIVYDGCNFYRGQTGQKANAVSGTNPALSWTNGAPRYRFQDCTNVDNMTNIP